MSFYLTQTITIWNKITWNILCMLFHSNYRIKCRYFIFLKFKSISFIVRFLSPLQSFWFLLHHFNIFSQSKWRKRWQRIERKRGRERCRGTCYEKNYHGGAFEFGPPLHCSSCIRYGRLSIKNHQIIEVNNEITFSGAFDFYFLLYLSSYSIPSF